ncbi:MAG: HNH endonuclease [Clostridiales bacterium]|nr:HNH endonuclease [Clostridiales bacterium]
MAFSEKVKKDAMVACGRSCCICHKFCGTKMEVHHIIAQYEGGNDDFENAIPLCFDCHAEVKAYNEKHPKGIKFSPKELKAHRDNWYKTIKRADYKKQDQDIPPVKIVKPKRNGQLMLEKITTGKELMSLIADKCAMYFDYDEPDSREEAIMISEFQEYITDTLDMDFIVEPSQRVMIGFELNDRIKELDKKGFWIFANQETHNLVGGVDDASDSFPVLYIKLVRKTNDAIICKK